MTNNIKDNLINFGFSTLEANYLALGHTLETETDSHYVDYRLDCNFDGFTLVEASLAKGVKNALWSYTEYEY